MCYCYLDPANQYLDISMQQGIDFQLCHVISSMGQLIQQFKITTQIFSFLPEEIFQNEEIDLSLAVLKSYHKLHDLSEVFMVKLLKVWLAAILQHKKDHCQLYLPQCQHLFKLQEQSLSGFKPLGFGLLLFITKCQTSDIRFLPFQLRIPIAFTDIQTIHCSSDALCNGQVAIQYLFTCLINPHLQMQKLLIRQLCRGRKIDPAPDHDRNPCQFFLIGKQRGLLVTQEGVQIVHQQKQEWKIAYYIKMMLNGKAASVLENQRFRTRLEAGCPNYAYEILLLEIIVEDDLYHRKPTIEEISRLIQLYMLAVEILEGAADKRYDYFKRKIHSLMLKKHIVQQMQLATGKVDPQALKDCKRADLEARKNEHEAHVFFNKTDNAQVQEILKKAEVQVKNLNTNIRTNIMTQQQNLQQRIKNRKMKSENGSLNKFKIQSHNAHAPQPEQPRADPRMEYFDDYADNSPKTKTGTTKNIRGTYGSVEKLDIKRLKDTP